VKTRILLALCLSSRDAPSSISTHACRAGPISRSSTTTHIYVSKGFPSEHVLEHERLHAAGYDHIGSDKLKRILERWKARQRTQHSIYEAESGQMRADELLLGVDVLQVQHRRNALSVVVIGEHPQALLVDTVAGDVLTGVHGERVIIVAV
jgi:hypothetical protein